jgi:hypothetical protein
MCTGVWEYIIRKIRKWPSRSDIREWYHTYPGDPTPVVVELERMFSQPLHLQQINEIYTFFLKHPAFIIHYSTIRTTTLQKIPDIIQSLPTFTCSEQDKNAIRFTFERYLRFVEYVQMVLLTP